MTMTRNETLRVGFFLPDLRTGGERRAAILLAMHWPAEPKPVLIVREMRGEYADTLAGTDVHVVELGLPTGPSIRLRSTVLTPPRLAREVRSHDLHWVVSFASAASVAATRLLARRTRVAWSNQSNLLAGITRVHSGPDVPGGSRGAHARERFNTAVAIAGCRAALPWLDLVLVPASGLALQYPVSATQATVLPNPVSDELFEMALQIPQPASDGRQRVVAAGRLIWQKRFDVLIDAVAALPTTVDRTVDVYGDGPLAGWLRERARLRGVDDVVRFRGFERDLSKVYGGANVFVSAADHEPFGNVLVEALAFGVPVVSTDVPFGPREILDGGRYGTLVPPGDPAALAIAIATALGDNHRSIEARGARQSRAAEFSASRLAHRLYDILASAR
jgi:glycosyltransferase involved in cell wall biosynthesis